MLRTRENSDIRLTLIKITIVSTQLFSLSPTGSANNTDLSPLARCMLGMSAMESILESILYVDHINITLHTFYFCLFVTSCVLPMHSSNERNTL